MLTLLLFVSVSAKCIAFASANEQAADFTEATDSYYTDDVVAITGARERFLAANDGLMGTCIVNQFYIHEHQNIMSSIYPLMFAISLLTPFAEEPTLTNMLGLLNLNSAEEVLPTAQFEANYFNLDGFMNYTSTMKSRIITDNKYQFTDEFKEIYQSIFCGETVNIDFSDSCAVDEYFKEWIEQDLVSSKEILAEQAGLFIASENHFTVNWDESFKPTYKDVPITFYESDGEVKEVEAQSFEGHARYNNDEKLNAEVISIDLAGNFTLNFFIPSCGSQIKDLVFELRDPSRYKNALAKTEPTNVSLVVPFNKDIIGSEDYVDGIKLVHQLTQTFYHEFNGFSSAFENGLGTYLSHIFHKMHLTFADGQDTETTSEESESCDGDITNVVVDRPYILDLVCFDDTRVFTVVIQQIIPHTSY